MRKERAPIKATYHIKILSKSLHQHKSRDAQHFTRHSMYPIAVRLDTWFPQSEVKGKSPASRDRKARQIRRKSKTHKTNHLPS
jgi:hypothetical protein